MTPLKVSVLLLLLLVATSTTAFKIELDKPGPTTDPFKPVIQNDTGILSSLSGPVTDDFIDDFIDGNPKEVNGKKLFEGDIMLTEEQRRLLELRKFHTGSSLYKWPSGLVPYMLHSSLGTDAISAIMGAIANWEANTCLTFQSTTFSSQPHLNFVRDNGCWSYIGRVYRWNGQRVSIGPGCEAVGIAIHEIGHAIGFFHEQSRSDRDNFIHVNEENIIDGVESNFQMASTVNSVPYDYSSIMHYSVMAGSKNGLPTISAINPLDNYLIQRKDGLTFRDMYLANLMYDCISMWEDQCGSSNPTCQNGGYTGQDCSCVCPPNFSGANCETEIRENYYEPAADGCTQTVTTEGTLSPDYSVQMGERLQCAIEIIAPDCTKPRLTFTTFDLYQESTCNIGSCCRFENLQFMDNYPNSNTAYCGTDISPGDVFNFDTQLIILFYFRHPEVDTTGWSAEVTFPTDPSCIVVPEGDCTLQFDDSFTYNWKSPDFDGSTDYPTSIMCTEDMTGMPNTMLYLSSDSFNVGTPPVDGECTDDYIEINHLYGRTEKFCGSDPISFTSPSSSFSMTFHSNDVNTATGFDISMDMIPNSAFNCHEDIVLNSGQRYVLKSPDFKTWISEPQLRVQLYRSRGKTNQGQYSANQICWQALNVTATSFF
ncbi:hypothetical protein Pcinc_042429 [Petrolisthes cinctipes]|uniref:Metalloendopeptidase n=1 Tax=Petrolisthes cinctipes TaxID=88211 RepID=A0AAE1EHD3_PETCI|nr:hypothetical protein Pcinc_042429 [Petrolisthes cinctipes]